MLMVPFDDVVFGPVRPALFALAGAAGLVLLIACANVSNLLLAQAVARRREMAVRLSQGAARGRLIRQLLTESLLLSLCGGALGLLIARWVQALLPKLVPQGPFPLDVGLSLDVRVLAFTLGVSVLTVVQMAPAFLVVPFVAGLYQRGAASMNRILGVFDTRPAIRASCKSCTGCPASAA